MGAGEDYIASVKYEAAAFTDWAEPLSIDIYLKPS